MLGYSIGRCHLGFRLARPVEERQKGPAPSLIGRPTASHGKQHKEQPKGATATSTSNHGT
jgi:hypothetical protein